MEHHQYRSELFQGIYEKGAAEGEAKGKAEGEAKGKAEGEAKGKAEGKAESILAVLSARGIPVSKAIRHQIRSCTELATLDVWLRRALEAKSAAAVVEKAEGATSGRSPRARAAAKRSTRSTTKPSAAKRPARAPAPARGAPAK